MLKKVLRVLGVLVILIILVAAGGYIYMKKAFPKAGPVVSIPKIVADSATLARGNYLANHVADCNGCHSARNLSYFGFPEYEDSLGKGGLHFSHDFEFPGDIYARNITPTNLGKYTDEQLYHVITTGEDFNHEALFPVMPYTHYKTADPEDIKAIIAYIRTLKPQEYQAPAPQIDFPVNLIIRTVPSPATPGKRPDVSDQLAYGKYMFNLAGCEDCHTPMVKGQFDTTKTLAGGHTFHFQGIGTVTAANITPDMKTGIGSWSKEDFVRAFKQYDSPDKKKIPWKEKGFQTVMPWMMYSGMNETDLGAIYAYLRTFKPIENQIIKFRPEGQQTSMK
jgi:mono/diheme cytochrome c family protein